ncbi:MAG: UDP-glucose 4-epimerase GalE [Bacilli bacterium]|nr:UDP-glucose 4-epimerase GalE [Bacilli bacterium]
MKICVTGGMGYIGSHTVIELIKKGHEPVIVDNLVNSNPEVLNRIKKIVKVKPKFYEIDLRDEKKLDKCFQKEKFDVVIHFAGLKSVGESVKKPKLYYDNNIGSSKVLLKVMKKHKVRNIIFSSSATVYGVPKHVPLRETDPVGKAANPYGQTKIEIEKILMKVAKEDKKMNVVLLRYFNPVGAHESGLIGEDPNGIPNNLMPYITQVAVGRRKELTIFGNNYPTKDGTCIRDYIHVVDLAMGHLAALKAIKKKWGLKIYNLGTGKGTSVLELVKAFNRANKLKIKFVYGPRRPGDVVKNYANASKAYKELNWKATHSIVDMCRDSYNWQKKNPTGYQKAKK